MFDDQNAAKPVSPPPNLPIQPEDMFAQVEKDEVVQAPPLTSPTMPIPEQPDALEAGLLRKKESVTPPPVSLSQENISTPPSTYAVKEPILGKIIATLFGLVILGGIGFGGWWVYTNYFQAKRPVAPVVPQVPPVTSPDTVEPPTTPVTTPTSTTSDSNDTLLFGEQVDTDNDGLSDRREQELGSDPQKKDTDGDEVNDGDEVLIWHTDPIHPDTDSDGYPDGQEIKNGYNPNGAGKLFNVPTTTTTPTSTI
jgi:hypothetical protein